MHLLDAAHLDDIGACAAHISAAHIQEVGQIDHMGLLGTVFQNGLALGHYSGAPTSTTLPQSSGKRKSAMT